MSKAEVERVAGLPDRILAVNESRDGYQEVLEYRTSRGEIYALEFWDDYLTGYEYLYEDVQYVPSLYPPVVYPPYGRPLYAYPGGVYRPGYRPGYNTNSGYQTRPPAGNRPGNNNNNNNSGNQNSRPSTSRESGRTNNQNSSTQSSSSETSRSTNRTNRSE